MDDIISLEINGKITKKKLPCGCEAWYKGDEMIVCWHTEDSMRWNERVLEPYLKEIERIIKEKIANNEED